MAFSLVRSLVRNTLKHGGDLLGGGVIPIGSIAAGVYDDWCAEDAGGASPAPAASAAPLRLQIEQAAQNPTDFLARVEAELAEAAAGRTDTERRAVLTYLRQVPGKVQASLRRPDDPTGRTIPPSLPLRKADDLLPFLPDRMPRFQPGERPVLGTDLVVEHLLGVGGFGEVWKAVHKSRPHLAPVALKFCTSEAAARSLRKEVELLDRVASQGRHRGIVELRYAHLEGETPCLEYEYVDGGDLGGLIAELHAAGRATPEAAAYLVFQLAQAVGFAHRLSPPIAHRDLKPANILTTREGGKVVLKVADFGIGGIAAAHALQEWVGAGGSASHSGTATQSLGSCTPLYASPQQRRFGPPDPRDDVYALGVIWYQILVGDTTKEAPRGGAWKKRLGEQGVKHEMVSLLERCMEDDPVERPADAQALAEELKALGQAARPAPPVPPAPAPPPVPVAKWFYLRDGKRLGPVTLPELKEMAAAGTLDHADPVWTEGMGEWAEAGSVNGLCPPRVAAPPPVPTKRVTGRVVVAGQMFNGVMWFKIALDGNVLGESRLLRGCDFPFETTAGEHVLEVQHTGTMMVTRNKTFKLRLDATGDYRLTLKPTAGFLAMNPGFAEPEVQRVGEAT